MSLSKQQLKFICWLTLLGLATLPGIAHGAELVLRQRFIPTGSVIHLGDIADIHAADGVEARRLATLPLWAAPAEGEQRFASVTAVCDALRLQGIDPKGFEFTGATRVAIGADAPATNQGPKRPTAEVPPAAGNATIGSGFRPPREPLAGEAGPTASKPLVADRSAVADQLREEVLLYLEQMSGNIGHFDIELRLSYQQVDLLVRQTGVPILKGGRAPWTGRQLLTAEFATVAGPQTLTFAVDVLDTTPVVVARRALARGQTITAADVELQTPTREMRIAPSRAVHHDVEAAVGLEAGRAIRAGEVMTAELCLAPLMIERNQIVTVTIAGGGIELSRQAKAIAPARLGEFTEVQMLNSKERLAARVVGAGKLAIADTAPSTPAPSTAPRPRKYQP